MPAARAAVAASRNRPRWSAIPAPEFALVKLVLLDHQHLLDKVGMVQQDALLHQHVEENDIAVLPREGPQHVQRIAPDLQRHADDGLPFRTGRSSTTFDWHARASSTQLNPIPR